MKLQKLELENIRSYVSGSITFPEGRVLLSGNIGSGKSTILHAIEFALFGLRRGSGASLLRTGESRGSATLYFLLNGNEITVSRTLKRTSSGISQDAGYISVNSERYDGTALELKQRILEMLSYPKDMLTKENLVYRYTVYTPQEHMKEILLGDRDSRLDTLRRVFGIDRYKRIRENAKIIVSGIKEKRREYSGRIADLDTRKEEAILLETELEDTKKSTLALQPDIDTALKNIESKKENEKSLEETIVLFRELQNELRIKDQALLHKLQEKKQLSSDLEKTESELASVNLDEHPIDSEELALKLNSEKKLLQEHETILQDLLGKIQETRTKSESSRILKESIKDLNNCPTCHQEVSSDYKSGISQREDNKIKEYSLHLESLESKEKLLRQEILKVRENIEKLGQDIHRCELLKVKKEALEEKKKKRDELFSRITGIKLEIGEINASKSTLFSKLQPLDGIEDRHKAIRSEIDKDNEILKDLEIRKATFIAKTESLDKRVTALKDEIKVKEKLKDELVSLIRLQSWIEEQFISLMSTMEKNVMLKVHNDFSSLFENWFRTLIDSEVLNMRLDDDFGPLIQQNGYDIEYGYLSGGEKTAAALAYRLALNQVINKLMVAIKTNDLLILDEPTDGFSNEQLDRMKDVLDELDISQVIIVSHEPKIESCVDSVVRLSKNAHISRID